MTRLAEVEALLRAGESGPALELLDAVQADAARLRAVALRLQGDPWAEEAASAAGDGPDAYLHLARSWRDAGEAALARAATELALALQPDGGGALVLLGELARDAGEPERALALFAAAAEAEPDNFWAQLHLAEEHRRAGNLAEAQAAAEATLRIAPGDAHALMSLGLCARLAGDGEAAIAHFHAAREADPDNRWTWLNLAEEQRAQGATEDAEATLGGMLERFPQDGQAVVALGLCRRDRGDLAGALAQFEAATEAEAENGWAWLHLAQAQRDLGAAEAAEDAAARAAALLPGNGTALLLLAEGALRRGATEEALWHYERAADSDPGSPWAWIGLAELHRAAGAWDAARQALAEVLARHHEHMHALIALARVEVEAGAPEAASEALGRAAAAHPEAPEPCLEQASLAWSRGKRDVARGFAEAAREKAPGDAAPLEMLANQARETGDLGRAEALYAQALALEPARPWSHVGLAQIRLARGDAAGALALLEAAEAAHGPAPQLAAMQVVLLRLLGEWPRALDLARDAAARWSDPWVQDERVVTELRHAGPEAAEAALAERVATSPAEQARLDHLGGLVAAGAWRIEEARAGFRRALEGDARRLDLLADAARAALLCCDTEDARRLLNALAELSNPDEAPNAQRFRPSQSLLGQLMNEYELDPAVLAELVALRPLPPAARARALLPLVRANPDSTGPAVQLVVAMREAGLFADRASPGAAAIPSRLCQFWTSPEPPGDVAQLMASWDAHHPGFGIERFDTARAGAFLAERFPPAVVGAFRAARTATVRADLFRLAWLFETGGFYADADDRCLAPLAGIVPEGTSLLLVLEEVGTVGNNLIGAAPRDPVIGHALSQAVTALGRGDMDAAWLMTGPGLLTRSLAVAIADAGAEPALPPGCRVLDRAGVDAAVAMHCTAGYKVAPADRAREGVLAGRRIARASG